jgi:beta-mannosidase
MKHFFIFTCMAGMLIFQSTFSANAENKIKIKIREHWKFKQENTGQWYPAEVPGCVHTDLMRNNLIPDPFVGADCYRMAATAA